MVNNKLTEGNGHNISHRHGVIHRFHFIPIYDYAKKGGTIQSTSKTSFKGTERVFGNFWRNSLQRL
jgi:hypothetical protein